MDQNLEPAAVCIVGAGAAGIALALELARRADRRVLLLESGGPKLVRDDPGLAAESLGIPHAGALLGRARAVGGATRLWAGQCVRLEAADFEARDWVPESGWPFSRDHLEPHYRRAERFFDIEGAPDDERVWERFGVPSPMGPVEDFAMRSTVFCPEPDLFRLYGRELAASERLTVLTGATVTRVLLDRSADRVAGLELRDGAGRVRRLEADAYVLACGGIENARLLLASADGGVAPGNRHDRLGRYFQEHPNVFVGPLETSDPRRLQEAFSMLYEGRRRYLPRMLLRPEAQRRERILMAAFGPVYDFGDTGVGALRAVYRTVRAGGRPSARLVGRALVGGRDVAQTVYRRAIKGRSPITRPRRIRLLIHGEQAPNAASRITLSNRTDAAGSPLPAIDWRLGELDYGTLATTARLARRALAQAGLGTLNGVPDRDDLLIAPERDEPLAVMEAYHHIGATRMASAPSRGVLDPQCRVEGVRNLYVAGSSVFPTSGFGNPTLTIVALALRLADELLRGL